MSDPANKTQSIPAIPVRGYAQNDSGYYMQAVVNQATIAALKAWARNAQRELDEIIRVADALERRLVDARRGGQQEDK